MNRFVSQVAPLLTRATRGLSIAAQDLQHRTHGAVSAIRAVGATREVTDDVLHARIRSRLGHVCSYPRAIHVSCARGVVELTGPVIGAEAPIVLGTVRATAGVRELHDRLERHAAAGLAAGLQGTPRSARAKPGHLSPASRLVLGGTGALATVAGLARGGAVGIGIALAGATAVVRSLANLPFAEIVGAGGHRPAIDVEKTITIYASVEPVFDLFSAPHDLVRIMRRIDAIERVGDNRWHWRMRGPAGITVEWDTHFDRLVPNELVSWKTPDESSVRHEGSARFEHLTPTTTRVTVRLRYWPIAGLAGYELARLFGDDPARELEDDLVRLKSLLERGKTHGPNGKVTLEDVHR